MRSVLTVIACLVCAAIGAAGGYWYANQAPYPVSLATEIHRVCAERHAPIESAVEQCRASFALGARADEIRRRAVEQYKSARGL